MIWVFWWLVFGFVGFFIDMIVDWVCDHDADRRAILKARAKFTEMGIDGGAQTAGIVMLWIVALAAATLFGPPGFVWAMVISPRQQLRKLRAEMATIRVSR